MSEIAYKLPPRKWYTLEQAVKHINKLTGEEIEVTDLIHYWITRQLEICVKCRFYQNLEIANHTLKTSDILYFSCQDGIDENNIMNDVLDMFIKETSPDSINKLSGEVCIGGKAKDVLDDPQAVFIHMTGKKIILNGFLSLIYIYSEKEIENSYIENGLSSETFILATPSNNENRILFEIAANSKITIPMKYFYVLDKDLNDLLNNQANPPKQEERTHPKTLNSQAEFIRNLITIHYGEKVANNIRNELENPRSRITCEFEKNGLKAPSGKAVDRWINQP